jgi:hypothetical protein
VLSGYGLIVSFLFFVIPFAAALIVAVLGVATGLVLTPKVFVFVPAGKRSVGTLGCAIDGFVLDSVTLMSLGAAAHSRVMGWHQRRGDQRQR